MRLLIIQIPCLNEEKALPETLRDLPRQVEGFDEVKWLVIDDGSTDDTVKIAREHGVDYVLSFGHWRGLAAAFSAGLEYALELDADVIVNTDADNQYDASCIADLVRPVIEGHALIVVGTRPIDDIESFSATKKFLQRLGSWIVRVVSGTSIVDVSCGFRAIHHDAAIKLNVFNSYTYTLETIIQAGLRNIPIKAVPIRVNQVLRPSRLFNHAASYVVRSALTIIRVFVIYAPMRFFAVLSGASVFAALLIWMRFLFLFWTGSGQGHIQSLILSGVLVGLASAFALAGFLSDLTATNRMLIEDVRVRVRRIERTQRQIAGTQK